MSWLDRQKIRFLVPVLCAVIEKIVQNVPMDYEKREKFLSIKHHICELLELV